MKKTPIGIWLTVILLGTLLFGSVLPSFADAQETGTIRGTVIDTENQRPIAGALVFHDKTDKAIMTDQKGNFMMTDLHFGDYEVTAYKEGYNSTSKSVTLNKDTNGTSYMFSLSPALPVSAGVLKGKVFLEAEFDTISELYTADDAIVGFETGSMVPTGTIIDVVESDSDTLVGTYTTTVAPGTYNLFCWAYSHSEEHSGELTISAGEVLTYDFHLEMLDMQNSGLAGNITDSETGEPVPGASIIAYNTESEETLTTTSDENGFYFFVSPEPGDYDVVALAPGYEPGTGSGTVVWDQATYVDIQLQPLQINTTILWGFVFGNGYPRSYATVFTDYYLTMTSNVYGIAGLYVIHNFPGDEEHEVGAQIIGYYPQMDHITVPSGTIQRHDFHLQSMDQNFSRYAVVIASVWEDTTPLNPLTNSDVRLWDGAYDQTLHTGVTHNTVMFTIVPAGSGYRIKGSNGGYIYERYAYTPGNVHHVPSDTFTVDLFEINYIDIYMNETQPVNKTEIWGFVYVNSFSTPVPGAHVMELVPSPGVLDTTDATGYYQRYVSPDDYALQAFFPGGYSVQYFDYGTGTSGAGPWNGTVSPGESRHVDFIMKSNEKQFSIIAGQVLDYSTHAPVPGFEVKAYNTGQFFPAINADGFGFFMFSPIMDFATDWTVNGYSPVHMVSVVEYDFLSSWTPMNHPDLPVSFTHAPAEVMWLNIFVNKTEDQPEKTKLWGKVFLDDFGGVEIEGVAVIEQLVSPGLFDVTDHTGTYARTVASGLTYGLDVSYPAAYSIRYYDHETGATGAGSWSGSVSGTHYRVDFALKVRTKEYAVIMGQVTLDSDGSPLSGLTVSAENTGGSTAPDQITDSYGLFEFNPVIDLSSDWVVDSSFPGYSVVSVEYHLLGVGSPVSSSSLPVDFTLSSMEIMWLDIRLNVTNEQDGNVFGKVYRLPDNEHAIGAEVKIIRAGESSPTDSMILGDDALYDFDVPGGDYLIKVSLSGYLPQSEVVTVIPGDSVYQPFYLPPSSRVNRFEPVNIRLLETESGVPLKDHPVIILGVGKNTTDEDGYAGFAIVSSGNFTIGVDAEMVSVSEGTSDPVEIKDGKVYLEPGKEYVIRVRSSFVESDTRSEEGQDGSIEVPYAALVAGTLAALAIGGVAGFLGRRPGKPDLEE